MADALTVPRRAQVLESFDWAVAEAFDTPLGATDYSSQVAKLRNRLTLAQDEAEIGNVFGEVEKLRELVRG